MLQTMFCKIAIQAVDRIKEESSRGLDEETFQLRLDVSEQHEYQQFIQYYFIELKPGATVGNLMDHLSTYWDFFNYGLLKHVIDTFEINSLKRDLEDYIGKLRAFRESTKLCNFTNKWLVRGQESLKSDFRDLVIKMHMEKKWEEYTLEDVEMFKETLTHKFLLHNFMLLLKEVEKGCVCLTWYVPAPVSKMFQENFPNVTTEFFKTHGVEEVTIDGKECF